MFCALVDCDEVLDVERAGEPRITESARLRNFSSAFSLFRTVLLFSALLGEALPPSNTDPPGNCARLSIIPRKDLI